jgi:hypothetical protein
VQVSSFVRNVENFLFETQRNRKPVVFRIVYRYIGSTELDENDLNGTRELEIQGSRDRTCDQSFEKFRESSAPVFGTNRDQLAPALVFASGFDEKKLKGSEPLQCYAVEVGNWKKDVGR